MLKVYSNRTIRFKDVVYSLTTRLAHRQVSITWDPETITFVTLEGEIIANLTGRHREPIMWESDLRERHFNEPVNT